MLHRQKTIDVKTRCDCEHSRDRRLIGGRHRGAWCADPFAFWCFDAAALLHRCAMAAEHRDPMRPGPDSLPYPFSPALLVTRMLLTSATSDVPSCLNMWQVWPVPGGTHAGLTCGMPLQ